MRFQAEVTSHMAQNHPGTKYFSIEPSVKRCTTTVIGSRLGFAGAIMRQEMRRPGSFVCAISKQTAHACYGP